MPRKRLKPLPISNAALGALVGLAVLTIAILGGLLYFSRHRPVAAVAPELPPPPQDSHATLTKYLQKKNAEEKAEEAVVIRAVARLEEKTPEAPIEPPVIVASVEKSAPVQPAPTFEQPATTPVLASASKDNNELIPEITGPSYTAKKAMSLPAEPKQPARRPEARKNVVPPPPKPPAKVEPPKPPEAKKLDATKAPVFVLNDGRRIRAVAVQENGATITVKNEAGTEITFKKKDVKEIMPPK